MMVAFCNRFGFVWWLEIVMFCFGSLAAGGDEPLINAKPPQARKATMQATARPLECGMILGRGS
jgi:hypothetical protein